MPTRKAQECLPIGSSCLVRLLINWNWLRSHQKLLISACWEPIIPNQHVIFLWDGNPFSIIHPLDLYDTRNPTFLPSYISGWISSGRIKSIKKNIYSWITWLSRNLRGTIIQTTRVTTRWRGVWFFQVWLGAMLDDLSLKLYIFSLNGYTWLHVSPFVPRKISLHNQKRIQTTPLSSAFTKCNFPLQEPKYHRIALSSKCVYIKYLLKLSSSNTSNKQDKQS